MQPLSGTRLSSPPAPNGSPLYEFRRYAVRTSETYLIAAAAVASALSAPKGPRPFEALAGWNEPLPQEEEDNDEAAADGVPTAPMERGGRSGGGMGSVHGGKTSGIGVPLEEARGDVWWEYKIKYIGRYGTVLWACVCVPCYRTVRCMYMEKVL